MSNSRDAGGTRSGEQQTGTTRTCTFTCEGSHWCVGGGPCGQDHATRYAHMYVSFVRICPMLRGRVCARKLHNLCICVCLLVSVRGRGACRKFRAIRYAYTRAYAHENMYCCGKDEETDGCFMREHIISPRSTQHMPTFLILAGSIMRT